jgi:hypothetical protein
MSQTLLETLEMLIMLDPGLQRDYEKAKSRNVRAAAARVRNTMQRVKKTAHNIRIEMLEIINRPRQKDELKRKKAFLEDHQKSLESQLRKVKQEIVELG